MFRFLHKFSLLCKGRNCISAGKKDKIQLQEVSKKCNTFNILRITIVCFTCYKWYEERFPKAVKMAHSKERPCSAPTSSLVWLASLVLITRAWSLGLDLIFEGPHFYNFIVSVYKQWNSTQGIDERKSEDTKCAIKNHILKDIQI